MADDATRDALTWAVTGVGGLGGLGLLGVFARGLLSGAIVSEKEMRDDLRAEVSRLRATQEQQQTDIDGLRRDIRALTALNLHLMSSRADARAALRDAERDLGRTPTGWPPDPNTGGIP